MTSKEVTREKLHLAKYKLIGLYLVIFLQNIVK